MITDIRQKRFLPLAEKAVIAALSLWAAAYAFLVNRNQGTVFAAVNALLFFLVPCFLGWRYLEDKPLLRKNRTKLLWGVFAVFALAWVLLGLNNSSTSLWREYLLQEYPNALWGRGRLIRSDEWAVWTPMLLSQAAQGYPAVNTAITASAVDPTLIAIGGLPAWNLAAVFKPFYWGFLLFGTEAGYSLMTLLRFVCLFVVSYLCALRYTKGSRPLSVAAAFLISLSPYVQWWYSQSICEVLLFPQAVVLCWLKAMESRNPWRQLGLGAIAAWCFGCFIMVAYPAWLIPVAYLTLVVLAWLVIRNRKTFRLAAVLRTLTPLCVSLVLLFFIFRGSWDTLSRVMNSVYPGRRLYTGGNRPPVLFSGFLSLIFPAFMPTEVLNASELSNFISFAPAGLILAVVRRIKTKEKDGFAAILVTFIAVFGLLSFVRLPAWLTQATLLSQCSRPAFIIQACDLLLLLRVLSRWDKKWIGFKAGLLLALACALLSVGLTYWVLRPSLAVTALLVPVALGAFWLLFSGADRKFVAAVFCLLSVIGGLFVNPVQKGFSEVDRLPTTSVMEQAGLDPETAVVAVEGDWPILNAPLLKGYKVFNSTQPFSDPDRWAPVDPEGKYTEVYSRLCQVALTVTEETELRKPQQADLIEVGLTVEDLKALGVNTLLTQAEHPELTLLAAEQSWLLYRLDQ